MALEFTSNYQLIWEKVDQIDPLKYGETRNYIDGAITYLSPYISRGVISTKQVLEYVLAKGYPFSQMESFVKELCWRDYFQRLGQVKDLSLDIKQPQLPVSNHEIPIRIIEANTGILGIDQSIEELYQVGYMHNHCRMYTASVVCNIAQSHWFMPSRWMYYHLLDGDWASNACSWQWVAGANSNKKYISNQENINRFTRTNQAGTFLDRSYETIMEMETPSHLIPTASLLLETTLPQGEPLLVDETQPTFIYNYYNLDPLWHSQESGNRILLIELDFFQTYPISEKCMRWMLDLSQNIPHIQVFVGSFETLRQQYRLKTIYYKEHPLNKGYSGNEDSRDWIVEEVNGYHPAFFAYWKKVEQQLRLKYNGHDH